MVAGTTRPGRRNTPRQTAHLRNLASMMTAISDRSYWLAHLRYCTRCPTNRCPKGDEIAAAVRETLSPGELWQGIYRPYETEHGPARAARERRDGR